MFRSLYTAASGMEAQELSLDNIANNLANANTTGFRRRRLQFQDLLYQTLIAPGAPASQQTIIPAGLQIGLGSRSAATEVIQQQGSFDFTGNQLDLAIQGAGFFQVLLPSGEIAYTRGGNFNLDDTGNIVTSDGNRLQPSITVPPDALTVTVGSDGTVSATLPNQQQPTQLGVIQLANFQNPAGLNSLGANLFESTGASGDPIIGAPGGAEGLGTIQQGALEESNVNVVEEFVNMILAQRSYEANSRVVRAADEMFQTLNGLTT
ncbi:MAG: flagellar basal-body rod protein FlgG [Candidatus Acidiferrales bacterium]